jgi:dolichol kinase
MEGTSKISLKSEVYRKSIHLFSLFIPVLYYFLFSKSQAVLFLFLASAGMILLDYMKRDLKGIGKLYNKILGGLLRYDEKNFKEKVITGGTLFVIGIFIAVVLFQKNVAISAVTILIVCDSASALVGKSIGRHKLIGEKTYEGTAAFLITGIILIFLILPVTFNVHGEIYIAIVSLIIAAVIEVMPWKLDDNILVPLAYGISYTVLAGLFH